MLLPQSHSLLNLYKTYEADPKMVTETLNFLEADCFSELNRDGFEVRD